jgi:hypothetical protein
VSKAVNVSYVDFQKKKNVTEQAIYNSWYDKWLDIKRACDPSKTIVHEAIAFVAAIEFLFIKNPHEIIFNKELLKKKCKQGARQRSRFLVQLADLYEITPHTVYDYKGKKYHFVYSAKRTKNSLEILQNPKEFYKKSAIKLVKTPDKTDLGIGQKCLGYKTNLSSTYIDNRNPIEEINSSYAREFISESSILTTETNTRAYANEPIQKNQQNQHATFAPCNLTEQEQVALTATEEKAIEAERKTRSEENTGLFAMSDLMAQVLNEPQKTEETPKMNLEELPQITDKQERAILLSRALWQAFGEERSGEIQDDYKFVEITPQKVCIQTKEMHLNDIEKAKIRKCIQSVYGGDVTIAMQIIAPPSKEPIRQANCNSLFAMPDLTLISKSNLLILKAAISDRVTLNILNNRLVNVIETPKRIILEAAPFFIDQLTEAGNLAILEDAVVKTWITLELHYNKQTKSQKAIALMPETILKDREWLENHRKSLQELDN